MRPFQLFMPTAAAVVLVLAGCASDGATPLTTAAVTPAATKASPADTMCLALRDRIVALKSDGTVGRVEKAAAGKTKVVQIKRAALGKVAELNQANAEFQAKCSKVPVSAAVLPAATPKKAVQKTAAVTPKARVAGPVKAAAVAARAN
ncbi:MAG TPA: hypothetical protein VMX97_09075 [Hyphomicrobiaceae bacterium]|nr:hypothetical protein [Hyphomicrobiaceae bacterium]